ncbi:MAG: 4Fe-4S dicluster domain-containing protein [Cellulomonadaceae bacterium]|jgi:fumarate reductase iron-sulfur subunit|nr:4Fe-4S dicluster domain-containing protein [Cellulomonadaceae bacterium]
MDDSIVAAPTNPDLTNPDSVPPTIRVKVARSGAPAVDEQVPYTEYTTVLDVLDWLKAGPQPSLAFRASCRSGICGSCGVMVNNRPVLACETFAAGFRKSGLSIAPLAKFPVLRDLVVEIEPFLDQLRGALAWQLPTTADDTECSAQEHVEPTALDSNTSPSGHGKTGVQSGEPKNEGQGNFGNDVPGERNAESTNQASEIRRQTPAQLDAYRQLTQCINCLLCYAACPQYFGPEQYLGPAAIALAQRWSLDSRDEGAAQRFEALAESEAGLWPCTLDGSCTLVCPKGLDPKAVIGALQRQALTGG